MEINKKMSNNINKMTINDDLEIEIKVRIEFYSDLIKFLQLNTEFMTKVYQSDEYFTPAHINFIKEEPISKWLRLRISNEKCYITYKNYHYNLNKKSDYCDEYETEIKSIKQLRKILNVLGFISIITINKIRDIWEYEDYEISLDVIENLGNFVEIEYKGKDNKNPKIITEEMIGFLNQLNVGKIERIYLGYPYLMLNKQKIKKEVNKK